MSAPSKKSDTRTTELIGMDIDGQMYLWQTAQVRPVTAFEDYRHGGLRLIKSGHYVIHWQGHAITVHCGNVLDGRKWKVGVQFMCSRGAPLCMPRAEVEAMLLGEVVRDRSPSRGTDTPADSRIEGGVHRPPPSPTSAPDAHAVRKANSNVIYTRTRQ